MDDKRRWFSRLAIGLGALALLVALLWRGFGPQMGTSGRPGANRQQQSAQPQNGPGANAQPGAGRQNPQPQNGSAGPGGEARSGRPGAGAFGMGGGLHFPFRLIGGAFQWVMLALLIGLGVWMIRGRSSGAASTSVRAQPAQAPPNEPLSPTGEAYTDQPSDTE